MIAVSVGDVVNLKGNAHKWIVKNLFVTLNDRYEAFIEIIGEAWCGRTKVVPVVDLTPHEFRLD